MRNRSATFRVSQTSTVRRRSRRGMRLSDRNTAKDRAGLTLLEILLAAAILATALSALGQHSSTGIRAALRSELQTEAAARCQTQLNRLLIGEVWLPAGGSLERSFEDDPRWKWTATMRPFVEQELSVLSIAVFKEGPNRQLTTFQLSRIVNRSRMLSQERSR